MKSTEFWNSHFKATRRHFFRIGAVGVAAFKTLPVAAFDWGEDSELRAAIQDIDPWLTSQNDFQDVSRGNPKPHSLTSEQRQAAGLTRDTWSLNVVSDPENPARLRTPFSKDDGNTFGYADLMRLASTHAVRFPKVMTCLNIGCPLGNGIWEGVPLRDVIWLTQPVKDFRRVVYHGFHNNDKSQLFRSSLPVGRVLEDTFDLPPVILCYKLNGQLLTPERGGPVRMVVPESYGFKSIKWLSHVYLSNLSHANDTYGEKNNDVDSDLKTFCATLSIPTKQNAGQPIPITGWAQSGISGLAKVQVWIQRKSEDWDGDPNFTTAPWQDAELLPIRKDWAGRGWPEDDDVSAPKEIIGFSGSDPSRWPMRLTRAHWAILHPGLPAGEYVLRCRTIDEKSIAQPMPRPFRKSGHAAIEQRQLVVE